MYLQLGGNGRSNSPVNEVVNNITAFSNYLHYGLGVKLVIIGELLHRAEGPRVDGYFNQRVIYKNTCLQTTIFTKTLDHIIFWHHRGFWKDCSHLGWDCVHLNHHGMPKFSRSVRSAILHASHSVISILIYLCVTFSSAFHLF